MATFIGVNLCGPNVATRPRIGMVSSPPAGRLGYCDSDTATRILRLGYWEPRGASGSPAPSAHRARFEMGRPDEVLHHQPRSSSWLKGAGRGPACRRRSS